MTRSLACSFGQRLMLLSLLVMVSCSQLAWSQDAVVYLNQGWSQADRLKYYYTTQGSAAIPYDLYVHLEAVNSTELFRLERFVSEFGFTPGVVDPIQNPDGLPIGIAKTSVKEGRWKGDWLGLTCAACHNNELHYKGTRIRIDGGVNNRINFYGFIAALDNALSATLTNPDRFDRLAKKLAANSDSSRADLRLRLELATKSIHDYRTRGSVTAFPFGPGRIDALTQIHNRVLSSALAVPENWTANLAPAKPPFMWNAPQSAWVQWTGIAANPLDRNAAESMGVFIKVDLHSKTPEAGLFDSTMDLNGQQEIEELLRRLAPPKWPEEILGKIDRDKAAVGQRLFAANCSECHSVWPHRWSEPKLQGKRFIENAIVPLDVVATDPLQFNTPQFDRKPSYLSGQLRDYLPPPFQGKELVPFAVLMNTAKTYTMNKALAKLSWTKEQLEDARGFRNPNEPLPAQPAYKAGPRDGIWAVPPYLHNGSVPNLYELLTPAKDRSKTFFIGSEFDPVKVGVDTSGKSGQFLFDTKLVGNSNQGHSFEAGPRGKGIIGRLLSDDERWAIIEYLKSIPTEEGQITPYGGPKDPVEAWKDPSFFHKLSHNASGYTGANQAVAVSPAEGPGKQPAPAPVPALGEELMESGEVELIESIRLQTLDRLSAQYPAGKGGVLRDAHPKTHGLVQAQFIVGDSVPAPLRYGVFAKPATLNAVIRFSAGGINVQPDTVPQGRGMAIKLLGVPGRKVLEQERDATTQDFVMINYPTFFVPSLKIYDDFTQASTAGKQLLDPFLKEHPEVAVAANKLSHQPFHNPLHVRYWSETPYQLGPHAIKFSARPIVNSSNTAPEKLGPDYLREAMIAQVGKEDVYFEFLVQVQADPHTMPVEDSLVEWKEADAPFQRVALIRIPRQDISAVQNLSQAEQLSFTPWHSLPEHHPLGSINRARRVIYEAVSEFRHRINGTKRVEPTKLSEIGF